MTPFCFFSFILFDLTVDCKCAIVLPRNRINRAFDLPQNHFRYVGHGASELRDRVLCVKEGHIRKVLRLKESGRIISQPHKGSVCNRCGDLHIEDAAGIFVGKRRQSAVIGKRHNRIKIILSVVRRCFQGNAEDGVL